MKRENVIIIEDDTLLASQTKEILEMSSYIVHTYNSAEEFLLSTHLDVQPCIYLVDLNLPGLMGYEVMKMIRYKDKLSTIFVMTGESADRGLSEALAAGADDFLCKPYNPDHLLLKIENARAKLKFLVSSTMNFGVKLVPESRLICSGGRRVKLTGREFIIVKELLSNPDKIHSREILIKEMAQPDMTERTIDVHISSLRKKISSLDLEIETCRGQGYRINGVIDKAIAI